MSTATCKVLYVDDDADDQYILSQSFADVQTGADLVCASDAEEAIGYLRSLDRSALPCLIVLDLNMPKINGKETLGYLKAEPAFSQIPVVILSTSNNKKDREACAGLGADSYLEKPLHLDGYRAIVQTFASYLVRPSA